MPVSLGIILGGAGFFILFLRGAKMEKIKGNITKHLVADFGTFQLYREDFERAINQACQELQIDDLKSEGQRPWKAVCKRVGEIIFNDNSILKDKQLYNNTCMLTNYNRYNYNILNNICDEYIYILVMYIINYVVL